MKSSNKTLMIAIRAKTNRKTNGCYTEVSKPVELLGSFRIIAGRAYPHTDHAYSPFDFRDRVEALSKAGFKGMTTAQLEKVSPP